MPDPTPRKPDYSERVGDLAQINFNFLMRELWVPEGRALRDRLLAMDQAQLKDFLTLKKIEFMAGDTILVVDIETARTNKFDAPVPTANFYVLVLPPQPRRHQPNEPHYKMMQAWSAAYYHAVNESYGM